MEILVGIDFGTCNTVISYYDNGIHILTDGIYKIIPSKIVKHNDKYYCGNYIPLSVTENIITNFKHNNNIETLIIFFTHIKDLIITKLGNHIINSVITVPSNFNDKQRELIKSAFEYVHINVLRIINEPSAAALAYGLNTSNLNERILVIDTGGGTMDFTILEKDDSLYTIIYSDGMNDLGGNDFTNVIYNYLNDNKHDHNSILWNKAEFIKKKLSVLDSVNINNVNITRKQFNQLCNPLINKIETTLKQICDNYTFQYVIMVGGSSRLLLLQELVKNITKIKPWIHPNLETVVSEGACLYASIIQNKYIENEDVILLDVVPLSVGIELADGTFSVIIPKNTPIPVKKTQKYTTDTNNIKINIYQGQRKIAIDNLLIGTIFFDNILLKGIPILDITFKIDSNGIIHISIIDKKSGTEKMYIIKDIPKLEENVINTMINDSIKFVDIDMNTYNKKHNIYIINTHIENALTNLQINTCIGEEQKDKIKERFVTIERYIDTMSNTELLEIIDEMNTTYALLINENFSNDEDYKKEMNLTCDGNIKDDLKMKITLLMNNHPELEDELSELLEELTFNNISFEYIQDKFQKINSSYNTKKDYKTELHNLCLYLKNELDIGSIILSKDQNDLLIKHININLELLHSNKDCDWYQQLNILNDLCELL